MNKLFTKVVGVSLGLAMALGVGIAVGVSSKEAVPVHAATNTITWSASNGALGSAISSVNGTATGTITLSGGGYSYSMDYTRTLKSGEDFVAWQSSCVQLGKNGGVENVEFTTSSVPGTISSVSIECSSYQGKHNVSISVGSTSYLASTATSSWTTVSTKSGSGTSSGTITISLTGGSRALYVKSISVTYEETSGASVTGLEVLDDNFDELSDGGEINLDAASSLSVSTNVMCEVSYNDSSFDGDVDITSNPSTGFAYSTEDNEIYTLTFSVNGDYEVTIAAHQDNNYSIAVTYHVSGIPTFEYELYTGSMIKGDYVFMSADDNYAYVMGNSVSSNRIANGATAPTVTSDVITNPSNDYVWHIAKSGSYWTIQNASNNKYLGGTNTKNQAALLDDATSDLAKWTITYSNGWVFHNLGRQSGTDPNNAYLRNNTSNGWACYGSGTGSAPALFKLPSTEPIITVEVTGETTLGVGETATLTATKANGATGTISWATSNSSVASLSAATGDSVTVTAVSAGSAMVTASLTGCDDVDISFVIRNGTATSPYTISEARTAIDSGEGIEGVYATGIVSEIVTAYNSQYGNISYNISADGLTTSDQLEVFRGKSYNGENFTSEDDIQVGDVVVVYGNLTKYNDTYEFAADNQLVSLTRPDVSLVSISSINGTLNAFAGESTWDLSGLTVSGVLSNSASTVDVTRFVNLTTSDVPGTPESTTTRNVSVTATGIADNSITLTQNVQGTITVATGLIDDGQYRIHATRDGVTYYLQENGSSSAPNAVTNFWEATIFTFTLVAQDTYTISNGDNFLYSTNTNNGVRFGVPQNASYKNWTIETEENTLDGSYNLVGCSGTRYLTLYNDSDWRAYDSATAGNRKENTDLQTFDATQFATEFLSTYTAGCNADGGYTDANMKWDIASSQFSALVSSEQSILTSALANKSGTTIEQAVARYDYIVGKYGTSAFADFMTRNPASLSGSRVIFGLANNDASSLAMIIVIVSLVSITAVGGYFLLRKRKPQ